MPVPTEPITRERLKRWEKHLNRDHATPLALFAVGHDHNSGKLVICTVEDQEIDTVTLCALLRAAIRQLGEEA